MIFNLFSLISLLALLLCPKSIVAARGGNGKQEEKPNFYNLSNANVTDKGTYRTFDMFPCDSKKEGASSSIRQKKVDEVTPKQYLIEVCVKFSDGGEVRFEREYNLGGILYKKKDILPIEKVLKEANGIKNKGAEAEYKKIAEDNDTMDLYEKVRKGSKLIFYEPIKKIKVIAKENGAEEEIDFSIEAGEMEIKSLVSRLAEVDWRWHQKSRSLFYLLSGAHAMVALSEEVPKSTENPKGFSEVARFHFNAQGLNLYKTWFYDDMKGELGTNFVVKQDMTEEKKPINTQRKRGIYVKNGFPGGNLFTRKMSITELKDISLKIIGGRNWGGDLRCRHYAYKFVRSIVPEESLAELSTIEKWPENLRVLDQYYRKNRDGSYAFGICHNFDFKEWVKNHLDTDGKLKEKVVATSSNSLHEDKDTHEHGHPKEKAASNVDSKNEQQKDNHTGQQMQQKRRIVGTTDEAGNEYGKKRQKME